MRKYILIPRHALGDEKADGKVLCVPKAAQRNMACHDFNDGGSSGIGFFLSDDEIQREITPKRKM